MLETSKLTPYAAVFRDLVRGRSTTPCGSFVPASIAQRTETTGLRLNSDARRAEHGAMGSHAYTRPGRIELRPDVSLLRLCDRE
jgi:hypothetical protein